MSVDTATSTDQLVKGMFNIESAGYHGANALKIEGAAARGAKVENADLAATTDVLTTAMHNYHEPASQAVDVMNSFRMSASMGKMHMDDLTGALRNVLPIASQAGVKLTDVEAAISTMSLAGDKGASAGTHLSQMLTYLLAPTGKATSLLKEFGLTTQEISDEMKVSLPGAVQMITDAVGEKFPVGSAKYIAALSAIVGGNKSMKAMLELSGISLKTFTDDAKQLGPTMTANSTAVDGWTTVQSNFNFKMEAAKNVVEALMISVGEKLLPVVGQLADAVTPLIQGFSNWVTAGANVSDQLGVLQPAFQSVRDILPDIGKFLAQAGDAIATNLLPPLESLITNVGLVVSDFATWLDKSGAAKAAINDLAGAVQVTTVVLGTLIQGMSDIVGWFEQGGLQGQVLAGVVAGLGVAFAAIKIADTVSGFQKLYATWSAGEGILANLASAVRGKLSGAIDDFLANQAPNLKASMDSVKTSAAEAATAEEAVGTAAETKMAVGVEVGSAESVASLEEVGTAAGTTEGEIAAVGTTSAAAGTGVAGVGIAAAGAALPILALGAIFFATYELIANKAYDTNKTVTTSTGEMVQANQLRWHQLATGASASANDMNKNVTKSTSDMKNRSVRSVTEMAQGITGEYSWMKNESLSTVQGFSDSALKILGRMGSEGANIMKSLDQATQQYWDDIASYIDMKSNEAAMDANRNFEKIHGVSIGIGKNFNDPSDAIPGHASGTSSSPGGLHWLGEREPELVVGRQTGLVPQGAAVIPLSQMQGGLGGGNNQPMHIHIEVGGHEVLSYLIDRMGNAMMQQSILQYGGRAW